MSAFSAPALTNSEAKGKRLVTISKMALTGAAAGLCALIAAHHSRAPDPVMAGLWITSGLCFLSAVAARNNAARYFAIAARNKMSGPQ